jgi:transcriptional regulator with XRE-family HTH domain
LHYAVFPCDWGGTMPQPRKSLFDEGYTTIIAALIARRHELKMTQVALAEAYGEDQSFISRVERCQRRVDVFEFLRLCVALEIKPEVVVKDVYQSLQESLGKSQ